MCFLWYIYRYSINKNLNCLMDFFKKLFGDERKDTVSNTSSDDKCFTCENCGEEKPESQKKQQVVNEIKPKNVCEFC